MDTHEAMQRRVSSLASRIAKQPAWVRQLINDLQREEFRQFERVCELTAPPPDTTTFADPYSGSPLPVGRNPRIAHRLEDGTVVSIECAADGLRISNTGSGRPATLPVVSNTIEITWLAT